MMVNHCGKNMITCTKDIYGCFHSKCGGVFNGAQCNNGKTCDRVGLKNGQKLFPFQHLKKNIYRIHIISEVYNKE